MFCQFNFFSYIYIEMKNSTEQIIKRIKRIGLTCTLNDNGTTRHFHNGHEYVEIGGIKWATMNIGANSITDYGFYFQWGDTQGYTAEQVRNDEKKFDWDNYKYGTDGHLTKYNSSDKKSVLEPQDDAVTFNMGSGWRTPTREEFEVLMDSTTSKWVANYQGSGVNGRLFTDKKDNTKTLFFPAAGYCGDGSVLDVGSSGSFWSSSLLSSNVSNARDLYFHSGSVNWDLSNRSYGFAVRGVVG